MEDAEWDYFGPTLFKHRFLYQERLGTLSTRSQKSSDNRSVFQRIFVSISFKVFLENWIAHCNLLYFQWKYYWKIIGMRMVSFIDNSIFKQCNIVFSNFLNFVLSNNLLKPRKVLRQTFYEEKLTKKRFGKSSIGREKKLFKRKRKKRFLPKKNIFSLSV